MSAITNDFVHNVFFWLKNPNDDSARKMFVQSIKKFLASSEYAKESQVGTPVASTRDVVDSSYTFSLLVTFTSKEEHDKYQIEPAHLTFIEECKDLWDRVLVYDSEAI